MHDSLYDFTADPAFLSRTQAEPRHTIRSRAHHYRREPNGSHTDMSYPPATWYLMGARRGPTPTGYLNAHNAGTECRTAYMAGVMARAFGVDLSEVLPK